MSIVAAFIQCVLRTVRTVQEVAGLLTRELLNTDHLLWGSDYPHSEGTFPHSLEQVTKDFAGIPVDLAHKLLRGNAARLYNIGG